MSDLRFDDYQAQAGVTARYHKGEEKTERWKQLGPDRIESVLENMVHWGGVADHYKKWVRDGKQPPEMPKGMEDDTGPDAKAIGVSFQEGYVLLGLISEVGEVAEVYLLFMKGEITAAELHRRVPKELGDALWYLSQICAERSLDMSEVAEGNLDKLSDRAKRDRIHGDGDER